MISAKTSFHWEKVLLEVKTVEVFSHRLAMMKEEVCALNIQGKAADLVNDEHSVLDQNFELVGQTVLKMGLFELLDELVAIHVVGGEAALGRHKAQRGGQMSLALAWWAEEDLILSVFQEAHGSQLIDLALINGWLEGEVEVVQGLLNGKSRHLDLLLIGPSPFGFRFLRKDVVQNVYNIVSLL